MKQTSGEAFEAAFSTLRKSLVLEEVLRHNDVDVKVAVATCICEILRITASYHLYNEEELKVYVTTFLMLSFLIFSCLQKMTKNALKYVGFSYLCLKYF